MIQDQKVTGGGIKLEGALVFYIYPDTPGVTILAGPSIIKNCHFHGKGTPRNTPKWMTRPRLRWVLILRKRLRRAKMAFNWGKEYDKYDKVIYPRREEDTYGLVG